MMDMIESCPEAKSHKIPDGILTTAGTNNGGGSSDVALARINLLRSGEARLTRIALAIVWLFIFCHAWRLVPTIYEAIYPKDDTWPTWLLHVHGISHSFIVFNSAVNFLLYTFL